MFYLNRLFSNRSLNTLLGIALFIIVAAIIWYLAPFMGFGKTRPFATIEPRIIFILIAFIWLGRIWLPIPYFLLVAITSCALVWVLGPFILAGEAYPLASAVNRFIVIAIIAFITLLYGAWLLILALSANPALLANLMKFRRVEPQDKKDTSEVAAVIRNAAKLINKMHDSWTWWQKLFWVRSWRDELPWYMVLGSESSGKTSLIASSGQDFPLPEQLSRISAQTQPTKNCECWFANDALFIDTSGKYVTKSESWSTEWQGILTAIEKYRPIKAINGVILALSAAELMDNTKAELLELAVDIRGRLGEIRTQLGVRFPVYVVVTKLDRLAGFEEYFRSLTAEGREQIWGVTFPYGGKDTASVDGLHQKLGSELRLLESRIESDMNYRQQEEYAIADRKKMYALPQDFRALSEGVSEVLQNIFFASRYDETQFYTSLRGVYFSSSCQREEGILQTGTTLIQRWRNFIFNNDAPKGTPASNLDETEKLISDVSHGRNYFLKNLFSEIIVKDAELLSYNQSTVSQHRLRNFLGHCACLFLTVWLLNAFLTSYQNNNRYLAGVKDNLVALERNVTTFVKTANENLLPVLLSKSQSLPDFGGLNIADPGLHYRYGLYTGKAVAEHANGLYQYFLRRALFPKVEQQAAVSLQQALNAGDKMGVYDALKLYLMLTGEGKFLQSYVVNNVAEQWEVTGKIQPYEDRAIFVAHLNNLFSQPDWRQNGTPADPTLIRQARSLLNQSSTTERIYTRIKGMMEDEAPENITLNKLTGDDGMQIFTMADENLAVVGIPGLFTWAGYHDVFKKKVLYYVTKLWDEDHWVMGDRLTNTSNPVSVKFDVLSLYLKEYRGYWLRFLAGIRLISPGNAEDINEPELTGDVYLLRTLASSASPLVIMAREIVKQTTLTAQDKAALDQLRMVNTSRTLNNVQRANTLLDFHEKKIIAKGVDNYFSALRAFVSGSTDPKSLEGQTTSGLQMNKVMGMLNDLYTLTVISSSALNEGDNPGITNYGRKLAVESQTWPDPFRKVIEPLVTGTDEKIERRVIANSQQTIDSSIGEICRKTLQGRYPFADREKEASLKDVEHFFAKGGVVDDYFEKNLADKVDTSSSPWRYKGSSSSAGLDIFERASEIRDALFQDADGKKLSLNLSLSIPYLSPAITQLSMNIEGVPFKYSHGPVSSLSFIWPGSRQGVTLSSMPRVAATNENNSLSNPYVLNGPWALFRWLEQAEYVSRPSNGSKIFTFNLDKRRVDIEIAGLTDGNTSGIQLLRHFQCTEGR